MSNQAQNFALSSPEEGVVNYSTNTTSNQNVPSSVQDQGLSYSLVIAQVILVLGALLIFVLWLALAMMQNKPFNSLDNVYINTQLSSKELRVVNLALTGSSSISAMQENLQNIPWVNKITVSRRISGTDDILMLDLTKGQPLARMRNGKLLFSDGKLVDGEELDYQVPIVSGRLILTNKGKGENRGSVGYGDTATLGETITVLSQLSSSHGLDIVEYKISQAGAVDVLLASGGVVKIGTRNHEQRLKRLSRFLASYENELTRVKDIDLRHNKGLAVLWNN